MKAFTELLLAISLKNINFLGQSLVFLPPDVRVLEETVDIVAGELQVEQRLNIQIFEDVLNFVHSTVYLDNFL